MRWAVAVLVALVCAGPAAGQEAMTDTSAFRTADGTSFYVFDGCGDALAGRMFRRTLMERFAQCPFTPDARVHFDAWSRLQQTKSSAALQQMIDAHGGLPVKLDGMTHTCREQRDSPEYQHLRALLEQHARGEISAEAALPGDCDSPALLP